MPPSIDIHAYVHINAEMRSILSADNSVHIAVVLRMPARCALDKQLQDFYAIKFLPKAFGGTKIDQRARAIPNIKNC